MGLGCRGGTLGGTAHHSIGVHLRGPSARELITEPMWAWSEACPLLCRTQHPVWAGSTRLSSSSSSAQRHPAPGLPAQAAWCGQPLPSVSPSTPRPVPSPQLALCWEWAHTLLPALGHRCSPSKLIPMVSRLGCRVVKDSTLFTQHSPAFTKSYSIDKENFPSWSCSSTASVCTVLNFLQHISFCCRISCCPHAGSTGESPSINKWLQTNRALSRFWG